MLKSEIAMRSITVYRTFLTLVLLIRTLFPEQNPKWINNTRSADQKLIVTA